MWLLLPALIQQQNNYIDNCFSLEQPFRLLVTDLTALLMFLREVVGPLAGSVRLLSKKGQVVLLATWANAILCQMTIKGHISLLRQQQKCPA